MQSTRNTTPARSQEEHWVARLEVEQRRKRALARARSALAAELGVGEDDASIDALLAAGIDVDTLPAVEWLPMVLVAWADGAVQPAEREAILHGARADGIPPGEPAYALLERWLEEPPPPSRSAAWHAHLRALARRDGEDALLAHEAWVREHAREVAEADGGWLGFGRVGAAEASLLSELAERVRAAREA